jgi:hypothetical protein
MPYKSILDTNEISANIMYIPNGKSNNKEAICRFKKAASINIYTNSFMEIQSSQKKQKLLGRNSPKKSLSNHSYTSQSTITTSCIKKKQRIALQRQGCKNLNFIIPNTK